MSTALAWMVGQIPVSTTTISPPHGAGLQEVVWRDLAAHGPATVHELSRRLRDDHERVRNALYRLYYRSAVRVAMRVPSTCGGSLPRVVWVAVDHEGKPVAL